MGVIFLTNAPGLIVREADVGADKWRRTGVYTFTGMTKKEKRMKFKKLQERLCLYYGEIVTSHLCSSHCTGGL